MKTLGIHGIKSNLEKFEIPRMMSLAPEVIPVPAIPKMFYLGKFFTEKNLAGMDPGIWAGHGCIQNQEKSNTNRLPVGH